MLSIIVPIYNDNDLDLGCITRILARLDEIGEGVDIVCVDSSTVNITNDIESPLQGRKVIKCRTSSRGKRLQVGIDSSKGNIILLHHPRSVIDIKGLRWLRDQAIGGEEQNVRWQWGGFRHKFDYDHFLLRFTSWYSNTIRPFVSAVVYLDHCIFFKRQALGSKTIPPVEIFEDTLLSKILFNSTGVRPYIAPFSSITSSIRFTTNGIWKQAFMNQWLKLQYFIGGLGKDGASLNKYYEHGLNLNGSRLLDTEIYSNHKKKLIVDDLNSNHVDNTQYDVAIVGGGIIGLATARALSLAYPNKKIIILEKEDTLIVFLLVQLETK